jgi:hypothetical protein
MRWDSNEGGANNNHRAHSPAHPLRILRDKSAAHAWAVLPAETFKAAEMVHLVVMMCLQCGVYLYHAPVQATSYSTAFRAPG